MHNASKVFLLQNMKAEFKDQDLYNIDLNFDSKYPFGNAREKHRQDLA